MQRSSSKAEDDTSPWAMLYHKHSQAIFAYLRLHISDREEAEDLLLEVFTIALENADLCEKAERVQRSWLRTVAHNKLVDKYRSAQNRKVTSLETLLEPACESPGISPEGFALRQEERDEIQQLFHCLSPLQQQVLQLRFVYDLQSSEIAHIMGKRDGSIRTLLSRAITTLRNAYAQLQAKEVNK